MNTLKTIFSQSYENYNNIMLKHIPDYWKKFGCKVRRNQIESIIEALNGNFNFEKIIVVETGASQNFDDGIMGLFFGYLAQKTGGKMIAIDIDEEVLKRSKELFTSIIPDLNYQIYKGDSVEFLSNLKEIPNIVHLDSWDLNLKNPFPSALHGWREFTAIESKMPSGSVIIIDDNYKNGTSVEWIYSNGAREVISITYPMVGKGSNVYHYTLMEESKWKLIGNHYNVCENIKIIIQKK